MVKTCSKCGEEYPATREYFYATKGKNGLRGSCKACYGEHHREYQINNREKCREYTRRWNEQHRDYYRTWASNHPEQMREAYRRSYKIHAEERREYAREYRATKRDPDAYREYQRQYYRRRKEEEPQFRIRSSISEYIRRSLRDGKAGRHWESLVGYTVGDLVVHLESQFTRGMTWENYGAWHIDHIKPISHFNFTNPEDPEFKECWSLWNLQPMWAKDNLSKSNGCDAPPLPLLHRRGEDR